mmetsp:Transcript_6782/g.7800  ORF Transcript_6782/g.7800 Transcript_6782/m.7800 type:complete len:561 (+) Transcript_6782:91-1773(+)
MFLLPVKQTDVYTVEKELQGRNLQVDPRPIYRYGRKCEVTCVHHNKGTTVTITIKDKEGWGQNKFVYFRVYDPSKENVPSFVSTTYTYWGLENERAPFGTVKVIIHPLAKVIRRAAMKFCGKLTTCEMHDDVEIIEYGAFEFCDALTSITLSKNLKKIGDSAFRDCDKMESCLMHDNVEEIGLCAFDRCAALTSMRLSRNLKKIGQYAFRSCENMESCLMHDNVEEIGKHAFAFCSSLTSISLSRNLKKIRECAFNGCKKMESCLMHDDVEEIGKYAFHCCYALTSIRLSKNLKKIGDFAFNDCKNMESCLMHDNVEEIRNFAFRCCHALTSIRLSKNLKYIGAGAFDECASLDAIFFPPALNIEAIGDKIFRECGNIRIVSLPSHMNAIPPQRIRKKFFPGCNISFLFAQVDENGIENNQDNDTQVHKSYIQLNSNLPSLHKACLNANVTTQSIHESSAFLTTTSDGMMTPLHIMVMNPYADNGAILTCFHLNMSAAFERDDRGLSPLDYLWKYDNLDCLVLMIQGLCLNREAYSKSCSSLVDMDIIHSSSKKQNSDAR